MIRNVAILIFEEVEVLDFCGPFEVFGVAGAGGGNGDRYFNVYTVAENAGPVNARNGLSINPAYTIQNCPSPDLILIPGGRGTRKAMNNPALLSWIKTQNSRTELTLSVCTGALLLGRSGVLDGLAATTHHSAFAELRTAAPNTQVREGERIVDNGRIITSAGISAGMDMALHVVARLVSKETAIQTARYMEYDWRR